MPTYRDVIIDIKKITGTVTDGPITGSGAYTEIGPYRRLHIEDGTLDYTLSKNKLHVDLDDGPVTVKLPVTPAGQALVSAEQGFKGARKRTFMVEAGATPIPYEDCPDVDPVTLDPEAVPVAAWWAVANNNVVGGHVSGNNLILEQYDGGEVDAGNVRGATGPGASDAEVAAYVTGPGPTSAALDANLLPQGSGTLGPELASNGTFATNLTGWAGANWTWLAGAAKHTTGSTISLSQVATTATIGTTYAVSYTISGLTAGSAFLYFGGQYRYGMGNGTHIGYITATATDFLRIEPSTDFDGSIDDVSVKTVTSSAARIDNAVGFIKPLTLHAGIDIPLGGTIAIGNEALKNNRFGTYNTAGVNIAIGYKAGMSTTDGHVNAVGYRAAEAANGTGVVTAFGKWAGMSATTAHATFVGNAAGRSVTTGNVDVFGDEAAANTTTGNVAAFGYYAANGNVTGNVTAFGHQAGRNCGAAADFTAVGYQAGLAATATGMTAVGKLACALTTTGRTTGVGHEAIQGVTTGHATGVGYRAGAAATTSGGTFIGYQAGLATTSGRVTALGSSAALAMTSGNGVFVGHQAGNGLTPANAPITDAQAVLIGDFANRSVASATYLENYTGIGYGALVGASNTVAVGTNASAGHASSVALGATSATSAANQVMVGDRDIESTRTAGGVVLKSPDGTRYKLTIANGGTVSVAAA